jgi:hypothetical protein
MYYVYSNFIVHSIDNLVSALENLTNKQENKELTTFLICYIYC